MVEFGDLVSDDRGDDTARTRVRRRTLAGVYGAALVVGYVVGAEGILPVSVVAGASTPLARVGFALREPQVVAKPEAWAHLRSDVEAVRAAANPDERGTFDLVVAVRGLESGGHPEWTKAEALCRGLGWQRCDRPALEELERRSRP